MWPVREALPPGSTLSPPLKFTQQPSAVQAKPSPQIGSKPHALPSPESSSFNPQEEY